MGADASSNSTNTVRVLVALSLVANAVAVAWTVWPHLAAGEIDAAFTFWVVLDQLPKLLIVSFLVCGQWLIAFANASSERYRPSSGAFAIFAMIACAIFLILKPNGPTEALSYHIAIYIPVLWIGFFTSLLFRNAQTTRVDSDGAAHKPKDDASSRAP